jgi:hypothetical protein
MGGNFKAIAKLNSLPGGGWANYLYSTLAELAARVLAFISGSTLHIHGGHLHRFCARTRLPYILHLHGSDIRAFDATGVPVARVSEATRQAILGASAVAYSTPELGDIARQIAPEAVWVPAPISPIIKVNGDRDFAFADVFFTHSWTMNKTLNQIISFVEILKSRSTRPLLLLGLDLGDQQELARGAGFQLVPVGDKSTHINRMRNSKAVLGQPSGVWGVTDIEALIS